MKKLLLYPVALLVSGCLSSKVAPNTQDSSFPCRQNDGSIILSTFNSAVQMKITRQKQIGDTLFITYRQGLFLTPNITVPMTAQIHYLKCAGRLYKVAEIPACFSVRPSSQ